MIVQTEELSGSNTNNDVASLLGQYLIITLLGSNRLGLERDWAVLIATNNCNIVMHDVRRYGAQVTLEFLLQGNDPDLRRIAGESPLLAKRHDLMVVCRRTTDIPELMDVRFQSGHTFSMRARDTSGLLGRVSDAFTSNGFDIVLDHGQLHRLYRDEVPLDDRDDPAAYLEYRQMVAVQPMDKADWKGLNKSLQKMYEEYGLLWSGP